MTGPQNPDAPWLEPEDDPVGSFRYAEALLEARDPLGALRALGPVLAAYGDKPSVLLLQARAHFHSAQLRQAEDVLRRLIEIAPDDDYAHLLLGKTLQRQNRPAEARGHYRIAWAMRPDTYRLEALASVGG
ncbi:tetratricopeptide repeat protein [Allostreptomyces psammosilenae]|uniref:Flp pilus assembly protein TadD n=1 Tax=Allostreptomyces psammosilenae TaxID=1892865 RepID=A0A853A8H5_9ACTN|nr:tetratricopeptide repeat protein [Allostreptomyces psammosilenae]NYI06941.1 Flp pilus assembly protein TadD [Allostreptomyces psammosilenae]